MCNGGGRRGRRVDDVQLLVSARKGDREERDTNLKKDKRRDGDVWMLWWSGGKQRLRLLLWNGKWEIEVEKNERKREEEAAADGVFLVVSDGPRRRDEKGEKREGAAAGRRIWKNGK
ncbi:hypothetical protein HAX54_044549 [Datura stramonium]|uniref:Uncharacterized protein n=1 Tax=Datura stramonium TaxID=4076 RepID=A0ABS8SQT6_DATST|nr:hypothetical protein [Datura stramonium]